jgi:hypothetical protein
MRDMRLGGVVMVMYTTFFFKCLIQFEEVAETLFVKKGIYD